MARAVNILEATAGFHDGKDGRDLSESHVLRSNFVKRVADYNAGRLLLPELVDENQAEDWLLGRAVVDMLRNQRTTVVSLPESTNGERAGEPKYRIDAYDDTSMRVG